MNQFVDHPPELDQAKAMRRSAQRLHERFADVHDKQTIDRFLAYSYDELAADARITAWLPLQAERFTVQRLSALAAIEGRGTDVRPILLFLCVHNAGRSQMAMAFADTLSQQAVVTWSGGSEPTSTVNPAVVTAMAERRIDIAKEYPKPWTDEVVRAADVVVTMGCGDSCPHYPGKQYEDWEVADPAGLDLGAIRPIRDDIERRVRTLLETLGVPAG